MKPAVQDVRSCSTGVRNCRGEDDKQRTRGNYLKSNYTISGSTLHTAISLRTRWLPQQCAVAGTETICSQTSTDAHKCWNTRLSIMGRNSTDTLHQENKRKATVVLRREWNEERMNSQNKCTLPHISPVLIEVTLA